MRRLLACLLLCCISPAFADQAQRLQQAGFPAQLDQQGTALERKGQSVLNYMWVDVYAAAFYAQPQVPARDAFDTRQAEHLALYYFRDIDRSDVIKAATTALRRQQDTTTLERLKPDLSQLHASFQNIHSGDRYDLSWQPDHGMDLQRNGQVIFHSANPELAQVYLGIWLAPKGLSEELRGDLLGQ